MKEKTVTEDIIKLLQQYDPKREFLNDLID
jgi:hypothetical protein